MFNVVSAFSDEMAISVKKVFNEKHKNTLSGTISDRIQTKSAHPDLPKSPLRASRAKNQPTPGRASKKRTETKTGSLMAIFGAHDSLNCCGFLRYRERFAHDTWEKFRLLLRHLFCYI
jgi:hypothetical protein